MVTDPEEFRQRLLDIQNSVNVEYTRLPLNEPHFIINANTRTITIPSEFGFIGVKNDHKAENIYFEIDRYFDYEDLSNHTCIVQYSYKGFEGIYPVTSLDVESIDGKILFCWTIMNDATRDFGDINFSVRFYSIENDEYTYNFNTLTASSKILDTLDVNHYPYASPTPEQFQIYIDKTNEISDKMDNFTTTVTESENKAKEYANDSMRYRDETRDISVEEIEKIQQAAETKEQEVIANVETKEQEVLASIPEDYTNLNNEIAELKGDLVYLGKTSELIFLDKKYDNKEDIKLTFSNQKIINPTYKGEPHWTSNTKYEVAEYVEVTPLTIYKISANANYGNYFYCLYDTNKNFISGEVSTDSTIIQDCIKDILTPYNARYISLSKHTDYPITSLKKYTEYKNLKHNWTDIKWVVFGDSLTDSSNNTANTRYYDYVKYETNITVLNYGVSGTGYARTDNNFYSRVMQLKNVDFDVITFFGSFNDLGAGLPIGTKDDTDLTTLGGYINTTLDRLYSIKPFVKVGIVTPTRWYNNYIDNTFYYYAKLLKDIAEKRGIPCLDLYNVGQMYPYNENFRVEFYNENGVQDIGVHPNSKGHKRIHSHFREFLASLI